MTAPSKPSISNNGAGLHSILQGLAKEVVGEPCKDYLKGCAVCDFYKNILPQTEQAITDFILDVIIGADETNRHKILKSDPEPVHSAPMRNKLRAEMRQRLGVEK